MRKIILLLAIGVIANVSYGQKKPKVSQAEKARSEGNLAEAKNIIDEAIEYEKTKDDGKTWYYRGLIYASLDTTTNPEYQNLADNPLQIAMEAFRKADEIEPNSSKFYITGANGLPLLKEQQISTLWGYYLNKGVEGYQSEDTDAAIKYFTKTQVVQPEDTTGYIYAGLAAQSGQKYDIAAKNYYTLINDLDYHKEDIYNALIYIEGTVNKDGEKALEIIRKAKENFPDNIDFVRSEINALIRLEKVDEAREELKKAIEQEPNNPDLHFTLGILYDEVKDYDNAAAAYQKAIDADASYYNAVYNLAVVYYNIAVELIKEKNNLGISSAEQKKAKELQVKINEKLNDALPHWKRADELQPNDKTTLETLQYIYGQLRMEDEFNKISDQLETLGDS